MSIPVPRSPSHSQHHHHHVVEFAQGQLMTASIFSTTYNCGNCTPDSLDLEVTLPLWIPLGHDLYVIAVSLLIDLFVFILIFILFTDLFFGTWPLCHRGELVDLFIYFYFILIIILEILYYISSPLYVIAVS